MGPTVRVYLLSEVYGYDARISKVVGKYAVLSGCDARYPLGTFWTMAAHTTEDGYTLRVFSSGYLDWGVELTHCAGKGEEVQSLYYSPCGLSSEAAGYTVDEDSDSDEGVEWDDAQWDEYLETVVDDYIECYV